MKYNCKCPVCGLDFYIKPSRVEKVKSMPCCSKKCRNIYQSSVYLGNNNPNKKYNFDVNYFKKITPEKAYILGWIASDGSVTPSGFCISIHEKDKLILQKIRNLICKDIPIKNRKNNMVSLSVSSKEMSNDICNLLNIKPKKKDKHVKFPNFKDKDNDIHFIRGFFDGDGYVKSPNSKVFKGYGSPSCGIHSNSEIMLNSIKQKVNLPCYTGNNMIEFYSSNCIDFLYKIYKECGDLYLARKRDLYLDWSVYVPALTGRGNTLKTRYFKCAKTVKEAILPFKKRHSDSGFDLTVVSKIKEIGEYSYYDTGIKIQPMHNWWLMMVERSSLHKLGYSLVNKVGILDNSYTGSIIVTLKKETKNAETDLIGKRIVQIIPMPVLHVEFEEVDELNDTDRGDGGFGSSGA